jgi:ribosomal-protein-alanine N-acetyltransferase
VTIRPATAADISFMLILERASPSAAHWTEQQYLQLFQSGSGVPERLVLIADSSSRIASSDDTTSSFAGFLVALYVANEWELENIVVATTARRKGLGRQLMEALLTTARQTNSASVFLEVRESNVAARSLYEKLGFRQTGRRPTYYINPSEDALLYRNDFLQIDLRD